MLDALLGLGGRVVDKFLGDKQAEKNRDREQYMASNAIQMRVRDAEKAGIHPIFAMGAQVPSYSGGVSVGSDFGAAGQDLGRALNAMSPAGTRQRAFDTAVQKLTLQKLGLENEYLAAQIGKLKSPGTGPGVNGAEGGRALSAFGMKVNPRADESKAQRWEDEYGEWADVVGFLRMLRDSAPAVDKYVYDSLKHGFTVRRGSVADRARQYLGSMGGHDYYR